MINSWCAELCKTVNTVRLCWTTHEQQYLRSPVPTPASQQRNGSSLSQNSTKVIKNHIHHKTLHDLNRKRRHSKKRPGKRRISSSTKSHWDFLPPPWPTRTNFEAVLTSHLSTGGSSLIVGNDIQNINQVLDAIDALLALAGDVG